MRFSSGALFADWVRRSGPEGGWRVVGGAGLAELLGITGVDVMVADEGAAHSAACDVTPLARYVT